MSTVDTFQCVYLCMLYLVEPIIDVRIMEGCLEATNSCYATKIG